ncbi:MAG: hypothetical protein AAF550_01060 [Myxococcota bacterium]
MRKPGQRHRAVPLRAQVRRRKRRASAHQRRQGVALIIALTAIAILSVLLAEMHEHTSTAHAVSVAQKERLQAEYMAKSALNLNRMLIAQTDNITTVARPLYRALLGRDPPRLPVWELSNEILAPFCRPFEAGSFSNIEGMDNLPGECEIQSFAENSKININDPLFLDGDLARRSIAMQVFATIGGYQAPSPYDPLFERRDGDGQFTSRLDVVSAMIDWWDSDTERTSFDPGASTVSSIGREDDVYLGLDDPYSIKNAPFDSLGELRLVRGISDDFWATFIEPDPSNPRSRSFTIYGSGSVNVNEAPPSVLLARVCSFITDQPLCSDPLESAKFVTLLEQVRVMIPIPLFSGPDFLTFLQGQGSEQELYPMLRSFLGEEHPLLFTPIELTSEQRREIQDSLVADARIIWVRSIGKAGCRPNAEDPEGPKDCRTTVELNSVINVDPRWNPPPPNAGRVPTLGVFHYYRME